MKTITPDDLHKMSPKEALLLCIAHYKNIAKYPDAKYAAKRFIFKYKRKLVDPNNFSCACVLCEFSFNDCGQCLMSGYWGINKPEDAKHCMDSESAYKPFEREEKGSAELMLKVLRRRLSMMRKEEKLK